MQPQLSSTISYVGPVGPAERDALLGGARALLHLISFAEPFGLSVVESMATGTPVIAFRLGSMPELITDGLTGVLVDDVDGAVLALDTPLDRRACRADVEARFTSARMVGSYAALLERVVHGDQPAVSRSRSTGTSTKAKRTESSLAP